MYYYVGAVEGGACSAFLRFKNSKCVKNRYIVTTNCRSFALKRGLGALNSKRKPLEKKFVILSSTSSHLTSPTSQNSTSRMPLGAVLIAIEKDNMLALQSTDGTHEGIRKIFRRHRTTIHRLLARPHHR